jgi:voltage-gated potassium channel Kch
MEKRSAERLEIILAVVIAVFLTGSLLFESYLKVPSNLTSFLLLAFIIIKVHNIFLKKGAVFEDYISLSLIILFFIIHFFWGEKFNPFYTIVIAALFLYSIGLIPRLKSIAASKSVFSFLLNYFFFVIILLFIFAGFYYSHNSDFNFNGSPATISFANSLYFSTVTFTTVGYGDFAPLGINRLASSIQSILGLVLNIAFIGYILSTKKRG